MGEVHSYGAALIENYYLLRQVDVVVKDWQCKKKLRVFSPLFYALVYSHECPREGEGVCRDDFSYFRDPGAASDRIMRTPPRRGVRMMTASSTQLLFWT